MMKERHAIRQERQYEKNRHFLKKKKSNHNSWNKTLNEQVQQLIIHKWREN